MSPVIGAVGMFVTIQFFVLIYPWPAFDEGLQILLNDGFDSRWLYQVTHMTCAPLAIYDAVVFQPSIVQSPPLDVLFFAILVWIVVYVFFLFWNRYVTGHWSYEFLKIFGFNPLKWMAFVLSQSALIMLFDRFLFLARLVTSRFW